MGLFDTFFPKRTLDPTLKQRLIESGQAEKAASLERSINAPSSNIESGVRSLQRLFGKKEGGSSLRFEVEPGSQGERRIQEIAKEEEEKQQGGEALRFPVTTPAQKLGVQLQIEKAKEESKFLPPAEFKPGEKKKFAFRTLGEEASGRELSPEESQIQQEGLSEFGMEVFPSAGVREVTGKGINKVTNNLIKTINKKVVSQKFRADKLNLPDEHLLDIEKRLQAIGLKDRTVRTFGEMDQAALELGATPEQLLKESVSKRITDGEVGALRNLINTNSKFITEQEKKITANPELEKTLREGISKSEIQLNDSLKKLVKGGTEAGRTVVAFRMMAKDNLDADFWLRRAQKELGNADITPEIQKGVRDLIDKKDVNGLAQFVSMLREPNNVEKAITLWKAGLLTSPTTHLANIGGNLTMKALQLASDVPATTLDVMTSLLTGKRTQTISPKTIGAAVQGGLKGFKNAKEFLRTGVYSDDLLTKYDIPKQIKFKNKILDNYTKGVFRTLGAEDIVFRQAAMQESLEKQAWLIAKNERLSGPAFKARVSDLLQKPNNEMVLNSIDAAEWSTFQSDNVLADFITGAKGKVAGKVKTLEAQGKPALAGKTLLTASELVAPFTKTPTNIAVRMAEFSPLGFFKAMTRAIKPVNNRQKEVIESFSRATTGSSILWLGSYLADRGKMTGNIPKDPAEKADFDTEGKQPNSIRIGDKWFQLNRISPFGNLLGLGAEISEIREEEPELAQQITRTVAEAAKGLTEQTFLKGVHSGLAAVTDPERSASKFLEQSIASTIPSVIGRISKTIDPVLRNPEGIKEKVLERLPVLREKIAPRRDIFGEVVKAPGGKFTLIDPFSTKEAVDDPVINEAKKIGITIGMPSQSISGVKLTNREYDIYQQFNGKFLKNTLSGIVEDPSYQELSNIEKTKLFEDTITLIRRTFNDTVFPSLMIGRMKLPKDSNLELVREAVSQVNKNERTKNLSDEKKENIIRQLLSK